MLTYFKTFAAINYPCEDIHTFRFVPGLAFTLYCTPPVHIRHVRVHISDPNPLRFVCSSAYDPLSYMHPP